MKINFDKVIHKIKNTKLSKDPFLHLNVVNLFSEDEYEEILRSLPLDKDWEGITENNMRRRSWQNQVYSFNHNKTYLTKSISEFFESDIFIDTLEKKFSKNFTKYKSDAKVKTVWCRDYDGASITPHRDQNNKLLSFLFYLPKDNNNPQNGTQLLEPVNQTVFERGDNHLQWYDFKKITDITFIRNKFICWTVDENSFHSVDIRFKRGEQNAYRDTIRGFYFSDGKLPKLFQRWD